MAQEEEYSSKIEHLFEKVNIYDGVEASLPRSKMCLVPCGCCTRRISVYLKYITAASSNSSGTRQECSSLRQLRGIRLWVCRSLPRISHLLLVYSAQLTRETEKSRGIHCSTPQNALRMNWPESLKPPKTSTMDTQKQQLNFHSTRSIGTHGDRLNQKMADSRSER